MQNFHIYNLLGHSTRVKCICISPTEKFYVSSSAKVRAAWFLIFPFKCMDFVDLFALGGTEVPPGSLGMGNMVLKC